MMIDLTKLINNYEKVIDVNETITFDQEYLSTTDIRSIKPVEVTGTITKSDGEFFNLNLKIKGEMILPCSITLADVIFPFDINYESDITDENENLKIMGNNLDIIPIVWENIVTEIPIRVVAPNAKPIKKGEGWQILTEDDENKPLSELKDLLKEKEDE
ncbi:MAG: hypothetical protein PHS45_05375 [Bacilli bacterium]|nr:hypothetical protein [Bacilli bacterium]